MKNYCDICFTCNDTEFVIHVSSQRFVMNLKKCFDHKPYIMCGAMASFDDIMRCVEKWREYQNEQTIE